LAFFIDVDCKKEAWSSWSQSG